MESVKKALKEKGLSFSIRAGDSLSVNVGYGLIVRITEMNNEIRLFPKFESWNFVTGLLKLSLYQARIYLGLCALIGAVLVFYLVETAGLYSIYFLYGIFMAVSAISLWRAEQAYHTLKSVIFSK